jgi:hypothetical protein
MHLNKNVNLKELQNPQERLRRNDSPKRNDSGKHLNEDLSGIATIFKKNNLNVKNALSN